MNYIYLVTSEDYDSPGHPDEIHLATLDKNKAKQFFEEIKDGYRFNYAIYEIPLDLQSENHISVMGRTTWLSDCKIAEGE